MGSVELDRPYFYCVPCGQGVFPLDAALGLAAGRKQFDVQQVAAKLAAEVPYETAQELFRELTGVELSTACMHEMTNAVAEEVGVLDVAPPREEIAAKIAAAAEGRGWRPIVVLAIDGAEVPTRGPRRPRQAVQGARKRALSAPAGKGSGAKPRGFGSIWWRLTASCLCSVGSRFRTTRSCLPRCGRSKKPA